MTDMQEFSPYQLDALKELTNIGMGRAGAKLSDIFEHRVTLSVPNITAVEKSKFDDLITKFDDHTGGINIINQSFIGDIEGRSTFIIGGNNFVDIVSLLGYEKQDALDTRRQKEMLLEISNAVNSACLSGLGEQLALDIELTNPSILVFNKSNVDLKDFSFKEKNQDVHGTLLFEIKFFIKDINLHCDNIISIKRTSIKSMLTALERFL